RVGQDLVAGIELNAIARVGKDLDHKAFELDEFFLGHFFIDAQAPEKAITTLTRGFPLSSVSSCTWTRIITSGFFARAFAHSCSIISNFSVSVSICCINITLSLPKSQPICLAVSSESEHDRRMIAIAFLFVRLLYDCFKSRLAAAIRRTGVTPRSPLSRWCSRGTRYLGRAKISSNAAQLSDERHPTYRTRVRTSASAGVFGCAGS